MSKWKYLLGLFFVFAVPSFALAHGAVDHSVAPSVTNVAGCHFDRELRKGMKGSDVTCLQNYLKETGLMSRTVASTGYLGNVTEDSIKKWQSREGHSVTGFFSAEDVVHYAGLMGFVKLAEKNEHHSSQITEVGSQIPHMSVGIQSFKDSVSGWNIKIVATGFKWAPENVGGVSVLGEGHAHLMVDGVKYARLYGEWFHLPKLSKGTHTLMVTLNGNDHNAYAVKGVVVSATKVVVED